MAEDEPQLFMPRPGCPTKLLEKPQELPINNEMLNDPVALSLFLSLTEGFNSPFLQPNNVFPFTPMTESNVLESCGTPVLDKNMFPFSPGVHSFSPMNDTFNFNSLNLHTPPPYLTPHSSPKVGSSHHNKKEKRLKLNTYQKNTLEHAFSINRFMASSNDVYLISESVGMTVQQVKIWFQNKRAQVKRRAMSKESE